MTTKNSSDNTSKERLSIKEAAKLTGLTEFRIRRLIHENRVSSALVNVNEKSKVKKHMILKTSLDEYEKTKNRRKDNRVQYIVRLSDTELKELVEYYNTNHDETLEIRKRFQKKNK